MTDEQAVCPHGPGGARQVKNGQLLPEKDPCQICGLPRCIGVVGYDTQESFEQFPPGNLDYLRCGGEPIKVLMGVDIDKL